MIQIAIDERACVSCSLCAEVCPTEVLSFTEAKGVPEVSKADECFGCLSCSEICPSSCIEHQDLSLSQSFHHDPYALSIGSRLGADFESRFNVPKDEAAKDHALDDLGLRLLSMAEVFKRTLGGSLPAVGTMAGRTLAKHLPRYRAPESLEEALELAVRQFSPAWKLETTLQGESLTITVSDCFVREVCMQRDLELGGELCVLLYNYLAGYIGRMGSARLRLLEADRGQERCVYQVKVYG